MLIDDPRSLELLRTAGRLGCPVVLHLDVPYLTGAGGEKIFQTHWFGGTVENLERAILACPQTTFIGHAPGLWRHLGGDADASPDVYPTGPVTPGGKLSQMLERHATLYVDLSAGSALRALKRDVAFTEGIGISWRWRRRCYRSSVVAIAFASVRPRSGQGL